MLLSLRGLRDRGHQICHFLECTVLGIRHRKCGEECVTTPTLDRKFLFSKVQRPIWLSKIDFRVAVKNIKFDSMPRNLRHLHRWCRFFHQSVDRCCGLSGQSRLMWSLTKQPQKILDLVAGCGDGFCANFRKGCGCFLLRWGRPADFYFILVTSSSNTKTDRISLVLLRS